MQESVVQVCVMHGETISFEFQGAFSTNDSSENLTGNFHAELSSHMIKVYNDQGLVVEGERVEFKPLDPDNSFFILKDVTIGIEFHWEQKEDQKFQGSLTLLEEYNQVAAVNTLTVEDYLISVISSEMSATSSPELLKAHSVISRSWLIAQINKRNKVSEAGEKYESFIDTPKERIRWYDREDHTLFDVCADDHCQRYQGITKAFTKAVEEAVHQTRGMVLTYENRICDARFSKSCGGISEAFENAWEPVHHPYLTRVVDGEKKQDVDLTDEADADHWIRSSPAAFCNTSDKKILSQVLLDYDQETTDFYRWKNDLTQEKIRQLIESKSGMEFGDIIDLIPVERGVSGRLIKLKIVGTEKTLTIGKELEIRRTLSHSHLYSSAFVVDKENIEDGIPKKFILTGAGWGHGVGLCQIGAAVMAEKGYTYEEILLHYFRGARISKYH